MWHISASLGAKRMTQLAHDPKVVQLAKDLGLNWRGDCLAAIGEFALHQVESIVRESPIPIDSLDALRRIVADKFRVKLEFIREDGDVERIAAEYPDFHPKLHQRLIHEFLDGTTEGITLERDVWDPRRFQYLAVVDARGARAPRAYFTAWHEITHLLLHPKQLRFPGFRRTPASAEREKDPLESVVDHVTGKVAFYPPFFRPALERAFADHGGCTFAALDAAREAAAPTASLFATAMGGLAYIDAPTVLVTAEMALKSAERRLARSPQHTFDFAEAELEAKLRVPTVVPNQLVAGTEVAIRRNMRVPAHSVLARAYRSGEDVTLDAEENQEWWETSREGSLPALPLRVQAARRGRFVYGLISPATR
jgi:hypothetical protein